MQTAITPQQIPQFIGKQISFEVFDDSNNKSHQGVVKGIFSGWIRVMTRDAIMEVNPEAIKNIKVED